MKALILILTLAIVCVVLFVAGVIAPRQSRRMQKGVTNVARKAERKSDRSAGRLGDATEEGIKKMRHAAEASARSGRRVRGRLEGN
jgi:FtsZ-interacting cell division protein ZipA